MDISMIEYENCFFETSDTNDAVTQLHMLK
jgi:hypothetical protein